MKKGRNKAQCTENVYKNTSFGANSALFFNEMEINFDILHNLTQKNLACFYLYQDFWKYKKNFFRILISFLLWENCIVRAIR